MKCWMKSVGLVSVVLATVLSVIAFSTGEARAQTCTFTTPSFDFGDIDLTLGTTFELTANLTATCTGTPNARIRFCPNFGAGTGGHSGTGDPRHMLNGGNQLNYNIFRNGGFTNIWGSTLWFFNPPQPRLRLDATGNGTRTRPVRVRIYGGQTTLPVGLYTTSFSGGHTLFSYDYFTGGVNCNTIGVTNGVQVPFTIQANHIGSCTVTANNLNFGVLTLLTGNSDSTTTVSVTCTSGASYQVGLNGGLTGAVDPTQRKMAFGVNQITYGLYQDASRSTPWGNTLLVDTLAGTGTGAAQSLTVYGRVPPQTTPVPGAYSDTIVVTVTY